MTTTKLTLYNNALLALGERPLSSLSESREPRRVLDQVWDSGFLRYILEKGYWNFAIRTVEGTASTSITPGFGYTCAYDKPTDWVRTVAVASDEFFTSPLVRYEDERGYWFCDIDPLYIRYVSSHADYGASFSLWPETFTRYAEMQLAEQASRRLTQSKSDLEDIRKRVKALLLDARAKDAMNEPPRRPAAGRWTSSRGGRGIGRQGTEGLVE